MYGALESVAVLWRLRSYRDIIIIIIIISPGAEGCTVADLLYDVSMNGADGRERVDAGWN